MKNSWSGGLSEILTLNNLINFFYEFYIRHSYTGALHRNFRRNNIISYETLCTFHLDLTHKPKTPFDKNYLKFITSPPS